MEDKINRLANIKTIGWTTIICFGFLGLYFIFYYINITIMVSNNPIAEMSDSNEQELKKVLDNIAYVANRVKGILLMALIYIAFVLTGATGLVRLKKWGLMIYHATSIIFITAIIYGVAYYWWILRDAKDMDEHFSLVQKYQFITYGSMALLAAWILTRTNILLARKDYRLEFK